MHWLGEAQHTLAFYYRFYMQSATEIIIQCLHCFTGQPSITLSRRSVLNFKFLVLTFLRSMASQWASGKKWAKWKYSTPIYVQCDSMYRSKFCCQELWAAYCAFPIRRQSLPAACHLVEENLLAFLRCWLSSRVKNVLMLCKLGSDEYSSCEIKFSMELAGSYCWPKLCSLLRSIFRSYIGLWVKIWHRNKSVCFELNHVQISSSKRTTDQRKGRLLRFE